MGVATGMRQTLCLRGTPLLQESHNRSHATPKGSQVIVTPWEGRDVGGLGL